MDYSLERKKRSYNCSYFSKNLDTSNRKTNKIWTDKGNEFNKRPVKSWLQDNDIEMYATDNKRQYVLC